MENEQGLRSIATAVYACGRQGASSWIVYRIVKGWLRLAERREVS